MTLQFGNEIVHIFGCQHYHTNMVMPAYSANLAANAFI
jgi:hypothetical protein